MTSNGHMPIVCLAFAGTGILAHSSPNRPFKIIRMAQPLTRALIWATEAEGIILADILTDPKNFLDLKETLNFW